MGTRLRKGVKMCENENEKCEQTSCRHCRAAHADPDRKGEVLLINEIFRGGIFIGVQSRGLIPPSHAPAEQCHCDFAHLGNLWDAFMRQQNMT